MLRVSVPAAEVAARRRQARQVEGWFPGVTVWWGPRTGLWLALVRDRPQGLRLLEARDVRELAQWLARDRQEGVRRG